MAYWTDNKIYKNYTLYYSQCNELLDDTEKNKILQDLQEGLKEYDVFQYFNAQPNIFQDYSHLVIAKENETGKTIGLIGVKKFINGDIRFLYFWTAAISEKYHGTLLIYHIYKWLLHKTFSTDGFYNIISTKTYNPIVYNLFFKNQSTLGDDILLYPQIESQNNTFMSELAEQVFNCICPQLELEIDSGRVVGGQGVLAPNFFPNLPHCSNEVVYNHFKANLTPNDQILCVLYIPKESESKFGSLISN